MTAGVSEAVELLHAASPAAVDVFTRIVTHSPIPRIDIAKTTGLSQAAVTKAVAPLMAAGVVADSTAQTRSSGRGRPASPIEVVPDALLLVGVKVTTTDAIGVVTDLAGVVRERATVHLASREFDVVVEAVLGVVAQLRAALGDRDSRLAGVGVAVSGDVDSRTGTVRESGLLGWRDQPLGAVLEERLGFVVLVDNDVRCLTVAETWFGAGVGVDSFAMVTIGSGIGCGLYLNGEIVQGAYGVAGEIGHLPLASEEYVCSCGRRGCVEAVASSEAILAAVNAGRSKPALTIDDAVRLAHEGDAGAVAAFGTAGRAIGSAIATMVNLTGPSLVLLSGEGVADHDLYDQPLREAFTSHAFGAAVRCRLLTVPSTVEDWARGAAVAALRAQVTLTRPLMTPVA